MPKLKRYFGYPKFKSTPYRFLFLKYDYFLQHQLLSELERQGHKTIELPMPRQIASEDALRKILGKCVAFKPDAVLALNNMGMDRNGVMMGVLSELSIPVVIWYLDNYLFTGPYFTDTAPELAIAASTDKALIPNLMEAGFPHAFYLPLATDISYSTIRYDERFKFLREKVSYVGGTFFKMINHFYTAEYEALYDEWAPDFTVEQEKHGRVDLEATFEPFRQRFEFLEAYYHFIAYVVFRETRRYRAHCLASLADGPLAVFGGDDWKQYLPDETVHPSVLYAVETPNVYRNSAINLSLTTFQQQTALNQRLFDVPFCNGFVLTDWRESLADHFELEKEVAYFHDVEELKDKVRYFLDNPAARSEIIQRARERILREHLMEHRVSSMLEMIKDVLA
ncbi:MAG: glycosyltransferase [Fidelibacterota bacterium]|nr:MAG: glycosyltransferase [Candidatus Neomarinimicrobiota bacterium]